MNTAAINRPDPEQAQSILLVDDEVNLLAALKRGLTKLGQRVSSYTRPADAYQVALAAPPDCVITDYYMPDINGIQLLRMFREGRPDVGRVILTGGRVDDRLQAAMDDGTVQLLLRKPFTQHTLRSVIEWLASRQDDSPEEAPTAAESASQKAPIMIVDDDRFFLELTAGMLAKMGHDTEGHATSADIQNRLSQRDYSAIMIDLILNGESGVEVIRRVRTEHAELPIIAVTGSRDDDLSIAALQAGASSVLHKPIDAGRLELVLRHLTQVQHLFREGLGHHELDSLLEIRQAVASGMPNSDVLELLLQKMIRFTGADRASAMLADPGGTSLVPRASYGCDGEDKTGMPFTFFEQVSRTVIETGVAQTVVQPESKQGQAHLLCVPMRGWESVVGVMWLAYEGIERSFTGDDIQLSELLAGEVAQALERSWLAEQDRDIELSVMRRDKLVTIGELASGVAHEINNPLGFVSSNVHTLREYFDELKPILQFLAEAGPSPDLTTLRELTQAAELGYILEDLPTCFQETLDGITRVLQIVSDLRMFVRDDQESKEAANVNQILDGAINILWNQIKTRATLERDFGNLPALRCYPSQLGQVFLNLLHNAVHAVGSDGRIKISTREENGTVLIDVEDNGSGIEASVLAKIFEPFYTTKPRGVGTGLGLSIARKIIDRHGGTIKATSTLGRGTTFHLTLPVEEN